MEPSDASDGLTRVRCFRLLGCFRTQPVLSDVSEAVENIRKCPIHSLHLVTSDALGYMRVALCAANAFRLSLIASCAFALWFDSFDCRQGPTHVYAECVDLGIPPSFQGQNNDNLVYAYFACC